MFKKPWILFGFGFIILTPVVLKWVPLPMFRSEALGVKFWLFGKSHFIGKRKRYDLTVDITTLPNIRCTTNYPVAQVEPAGGYTQLPPAPASYDPVTVKPSTTEQQPVEPTAAEPTAADLPFTVVRCGVGRTAIMQHTGVEDGVCYHGVVMRDMTPAALTDMVPKPTGHPVKGDVLLMFANRRSLDVVIAELEACRANIPRTADDAVT